MNKYLITCYIKNKWVEITIFKNTDEEAIAEYRRITHKYKTNHYIEKLVDGDRLMLDSYDRILKSMYPNWNGGK